MNDWNPKVNKDAMCNGLLVTVHYMEGDEACVSGDEVFMCVVPWRRLSPVPPIDDEQAVADIIEDVMLAKGFCPRGDSGALDFALRAVPAIVAYFARQAVQRETARAVDEQLEKQKAAVEAQNRPPYDEALAEAVRQTEMNLDAARRMSRENVTTNAAFVRTILADVKGRAAR